MKAWPNDPLSLFNLRLFLIFILIIILFIGDNIKKKLNLFLARGVRKVTKGITGLWQPSVHSDVAF